MRYNWQQKDWPNFQYNLEGFQETLLFEMKKFIRWFNQSAFDKSQVAQYTPIRYELNL